MKSSLFLNSIVNLLKGSYQKIYSTRNSAVVVVGFHPSERKLFSRAPCSSVTQNGRKQLSFIVTEYLAEDAIGFKCGIKD